jgi:hypothetical protein
MRLQNRRIEPMRFDAAMATEGSDEAEVIAA